MEAVLDICDTDCKFESPQPSTALIGMWVDTRRNLNLDPGETFSCAQRDPRRVCGSAIRLTGVQNKTDLGLALFPNKKDALKR